MKPGGHPAAAVGPTEPHRLSQTGATCCKSLASQLLRPCSTAKAHTRSSREELAGVGAPYTLLMSCVMYRKTESVEYRGRAQSPATKHNSLAPLVPLVSHPYPAIMCGTSRT